jgi:hypothetical protein
MAIAMADIGCEGRMHRLDSITSRLSWILETSMPIKAHLHPCNDIFAQFKMHAMS